MSSGYCSIIGFAVSTVVNATTLLMSYDISLVAALKLQLQCVLHAPAELFYINPCDNGNKT
jgi:hypothetical protein